MIFVWILIGVLWITGAYVVWLRVPPVPSRKQELDIAFRLAQIQPSEVVFDLGAGDGRVLLVARDKFRAKVYGWEINPLVWLLGTIRTGRGVMNLADMWGAPVGKADVIFVFLMANLMGRVKDRIWARMKPGARMVSNAFILPGVEPVKSEDGVYLYIKPEHETVRSQTN